MDGSNSFTDKEMRIKVLKEKLRDETNPEFRATIQNELIELGVYPNSGEDEKYTSDQLHSLPEDTTFEVEHDPEVLKMLDTLESVNQT